MISLGKLKELIFLKISVIGVVLFTLKEDPIQTNACEEV